MTKPIAFKPITVDFKADLQRRLEKAPDEHAAALLAAYYVLEAAYDDAQGVTAEFNRNVLLVLNRELQADFDPDDFDHVALFDPHNQWIEMRLRARREHTTLVRALHLPVHFDAGEELRTEISAKFTDERIDGDLAAAGLELVQRFTDSDGLFALTLARHATDALLRSSE